ncbi:hypothetical protein EA709_15025 [Acinetobacter baumannii]|uniref:hypothetical protein n=1 Tax=Acinetobacter baumannii TaxID=470 RepID=UPI0002BAA087|nr:hypothetical protein [Acinetobacter baumannii]RSQ25094.1 hypothetical protein EA709_15025 [Acinetobacter baumannii]
MDSIEFLNFSKKIISLAPISEIDFRQVVSRSYYCAFHQVKTKSTALGIPVDAYKGGTHTSLRQTLLNLRPANSKLKGIAFRLNNFHILRVNSDYKLDLIITEKSARESIALCEKIIEELSLVENL